MFPPKTLAHLPENVLGITGQVCGRCFDEDSSAVSARCCLLADDVVAAREVKANRAMQIPVNTMLCCHTAHAEPFRSQPPDSSFFFYFLFHFCSSLFLSFPPSVFSSLFLYFVSVSCSVFLSDCLPCFFVYFLFSM